MTKAPLVSAIAFVAVLFTVQTVEAGLDLETPDGTELVKGGDSIRLKAVSDNKPDGDPTQADTTDWAGIPADVNVQPDPPNDASFIDINATTAASPGTYTVEATAENDAGDTFTATVDITVLPTTAEVTIEDWTISHDEVRGGAQGIVPDSQETELFKITVTARNGSITVNNFTVGGNGNQNLTPSTSRIDTVDLRRDDGDGIFDEHDRNLLDSIAGTNLPGDLAVGDSIDSDKTEVYWISADTTSDLNRYWVDTNPDPPEPRGQFDVFVDNYDIDADVVNITLTEQDGEPEIGDNVRRKPDGKDDNLTAITTKLRHYLEIWDMQQSYTATGTPGARGVASGVLTNHHVAPIFSNPIITGGTTLDYSYWPNAWVRPRWDYPNKRNESISQTDIIQQAVPAYKFPTYHTVVGYDTSTAVLRFDVAAGTATTSTSVYELDVLFDAMNDNDIHFGQGLDSTAEPSTMYFSQYSGICVYADANDNGAFDADDQLVNRTVLGGNSWARGDAYGDNWMMRTVDGGGPAALDGDISTFFVVLRVDAGVNDSNPDLSTSPGGTAMAFGSPFRVAIGDMRFKNPHADEVLGDADEEWFSDTTTAGSPTRFDNNNNYDDPGAVGDPGDVPLHDDPLSGGEGGNSFSDKVLYYDADNSGEFTPTTDTAWVERGGDSDRYNDGTDAVITTNNPPQDNRKGEIVRNAMYNDGNGNGSFDSGEGAWIDGGYIENNNPGIIWTNPIYPGMWLKNMVMGNEDPDVGEKRTSLEANSVPSAAVGIDLVYTQDEVTQQSSDLVFSKVRVNLTKGNREDLAPLTNDMLSGLSLWKEVGNKVQYLPGSGEVGGPGVFNTVTDIVIDADGTNTPRAEINLEGDQWPTAPAKRFDPDDDVCFEDDDASGTYTLGESLFLDTNGDNDFSSGEKENIIYSAQKRRSVNPPLGLDYDDNDGVNAAQDKHLVYLDFDGSGDYTQGDWIVYDRDLDTQWDPPAQILVDRHPAQWRTEAGTTYAVLDAHQGQEIPSEDAPPGMDNPATKQVEEGEHAGPDYYIAARAGRQISLDDDVQLNVPGEGVTLDPQGPSATNAEVKSDPMTANMPTDVTDSTSPDQPLGQHSKVSDALPVLGVNMTDNRLSVLFKDDNDNGEFDAGEGVWVDTSEGPGGVYDTQDKVVTNGGSLTAGDSGLVLDDVAWKDGDGDKTFNAGADSIWIDDPSGTNAVYDDGVDTLLVDGANVSDGSTATGSVLQNLVVELYNHGGDTDFNLDQDLFNFDYKDKVYAHRPSDSLDGWITYDAKTITLRDSTGFDDPEGKYTAYVEIGSEVIGYTSINGDDLENCKRGARGTYAVWHEGGVRVRQRHIYSGISVWKDATDVRAELDESGGITAKTREFSFDEIVGLQKDSDANAVIRGFPDPDGQQRRYITLVGGNGEECIAYTDMGYFSNGDECSLSADLTEFGTTINLDANSTPGDLTDPDEDHYAFVRIDSEIIAYNDRDSNQLQNCIRAISGTQSSHPATASAHQVEATILNAERGAESTAAKPFDDGATVIAGRKGKFDPNVDRNLRLDRPPYQVGSTGSPTQMQLDFTEEVVQVPYNDAGLNEGDEVFVVLRTASSISNRDDFSAGIVSWYPEGAAGPDAEKQQVKIGPHVIQYSSGPHGTTDADALSPSDSGGLPPAPPESYAKERTNILEVDSEPPASVSNVATTVGDRRITLQWNNPADEDFSGVLVVKSNDSEFVTPNDNRSRLPGTFLNPAGGADDLVVDPDNIGKLNVVASKSVDFTTLNTTKGQEKPLQEGHYLVIRSGPNAGRYEILEILGPDRLKLTTDLPHDTGTTPLAYTVGDDLVVSASAQSNVTETDQNGGIRNDQSYYYTMYAFDQVPNYATGETVNVYPSADSDDPDPVSNARIIVGDSQLELTWEDPENVDFEYTMITRCKEGTAVEQPEEGVTYDVGDELGDGNRVVYSGTGEYYKDTAVTNGETYVYRFYSVDESRNYGPEVTALGTPTTDQVPPPIVTDFSADRGDGQVALTWTNPSSPDFDGVLLVRTEGSEPTADEIPTAGVAYRIDDTVGDGTVVYNSSGTEFVDHGVTNGVEYYYQAFAFDNRPNYADAVSAVPFPVIPTADDTAPATVDDVTLRRASDAPEGHRIDVKFTPPTSSDLGGVLVLRRPKQRPATLPTEGKGYETGDTVGAATVAANLKIAQSSLKSDASKGANTITLKKAKDFADPDGSYVAYVNVGGEDVPYNDIDDENGNPDTLELTSPLSNTHATDTTVTALIDEFEDTGLKNGTDYYYAFHAYDTVLNYAAGAYDHIIPSGAFTPGVDDAWVDDGDSVYNAGEKIVVNNGVSLTGGEGADDTFDDDVYYKDVNGSGGYGGQGSDDAVWVDSLINNGEYDDGETVLADPADSLVDGDVHDGITLNPVAYRENKLSITATGKDVTTDDQGNRNVVLEWSWDTPPDPAGLIVIRKTSSFNSTDEPVQGKSYQAGDAPQNGSAARVVGVVEYDSAVTSFTDEDLAADTYNYRLYPYDTMHRYYDPASYTVTVTRPDKPIVQEVKPPMPSDADMAAISADDTIEVTLQNDDDAQANLVIMWYRNHNLAKTDRKKGVAPGDTATFVADEDFVRGDVWYFRAFAEDSASPKVRSKVVDSFETEQGIWVIEGLESNGGEGNTAPSAPTVSISPQDPLAQEDIICEATDVSDPDGDAFAVFYQWYSAGEGETEFTAMEGQRNRVLPYEATEAGAKYLCQVYAQDAFGNTSNTVDTESVTVAGDDQEDGDGDQETEEPNDTRENATYLAPTTDLDQSYAISPAGDIDYFTFQVGSPGASGSATVRFETNDGTLIENRDPTRKGENDGFDTMLTLEDAEGNTVLQADDEGELWEEGSTKYAWFERELAYGTYYVKVQSAIRTESISAYYVALQIDQTFGGGGTSLPTAPETVTLSPTEANTSDSLECEASGGSSPLGEDAYHYLYVWFKNGEVVPFGDSPSTGSNPETRTTMEYPLSYGLEEGDDLPAGFTQPNVVPPQYLRAGQEWRCDVYTVDDNGVSPVNSSNVVPVAEGAWQLPIDVSKSGSDGDLLTQTLTIGQEAAATNGFDSGIDSPIPPFLEDREQNISYLLGLEPEYDRLAQDIRGFTEPGAPSWFITVELGEEADSLELTWDPTVLPETDDPVSISLINGYGGADPTQSAPTDMRETSSLSFSGDNMPSGSTAVFRIGLGGGQASQKIELVSGWNLISFAVKPGEPAVEDVFGSPEVQDATSDTVWAFKDGNYVEANQIEANEGYWVFATKSATFTVRGIRGATETELEQGWHLIGPTKTIEAPSSFTFYGYDTENSNYYTPAELKRGQGYWIYVADSKATVPLQ